MDLNFTAEETAFRQQVRDWVREALPKDVSHKVHHALHLTRDDMQRWARILGAKGWLGWGWPKEFGGQGRSPSEQVAFIEEMARADAPLGAHSTGESIVAQALMLHGSPEQKAEWLTAIRKGERHFSLGYSEPEAGSDLAGLRTRAVRDGDDYVVNGQKLWSTGGDKAEYVWLAVRTSAEAKKHAGSGGHHPSEHGALRQDLQRGVLRQCSGTGQVHGGAGEWRLEGDH
jgi:alkylation response protein AidB-like acyl-CoA dehydrogenase